jgi:cytochrome c556
VVHEQEGLTNENPCPLIPVAECGGFSMKAGAQFVKSEDAIKYRQSAMFIQSQHVARLGAMAGGRVPYDPTAAVANAEAVAEISKLPWAGFGPGTEGGKAKREI